MLRIRKEDGVVAASFRCYLRAEIGEAVWMWLILNPMAMAWCTLQ